jgi:hypothetical protein
LKTRSSSDPTRKSPAWNYDWGSARWVHITTRNKSRPEYIGFVDEDEGPHVYLIRPLILNKDGKWLDSWTWREKIGPLPELKMPGDYFGEVIVYKWDIVKIQEIDYPGEIARCWYCGRRIPKGRFCEPKHEFVFRMMGLGSEMLDEDEVGPGRWTAEDSSLELERQYSLENITSDIERVKVKTEKDFADKIETITKLMEHETALSGIYLQQCMTKDKIGIGYKQNFVLNNTIGNQPYRSVSALLLIRNSLYGSARPILRQFFESLIIAKYAEQDPSLARKWHVQDESSHPSEQVSLSRDVLGTLGKRGKEVSALRRTWRDLCSMTHATRQSQQVLRVPDPAEPEEFEEYLRISDYSANTEYSLDLLFLVLAMNFHLISDHLAKKADRWWFGNVKDSYGSYKREKQLKRSIKSLMKSYFEESKRLPGAVEMLRKNIQEYEAPWA